MTIAEGLHRTTLLERPAATASARAAPSRSPQRTLQLWLAAIWLLDAVLQIQPVMFTAGANGFSSMLRAAAAGNPRWIADTITWNASLVGHHPVLTNTLFALVQFLIAFGIIWQRTCKAALTLSVAWAVVVWWFGEGLGGILSGAATPFGGGPGAVLFYAVLAVVLWPNEASDAPFVAARPFGARTATHVWMVVWGALAALSLVGAGRSPHALQHVVTSTASGEPGWLGHLDRASGSLLLHDGTALAIGLAVLCFATALAVHLRARWTRAAIVIVVVVFALIWLVVQNLGGILAGGATDPGSAPLVVLLALAYWPHARGRRAVGPLDGGPAGGGAAGGGAAAVEAAGARGA